MAPSEALPTNAVKAAASSARARVTYANLSPGDPGYPIVEGGFWGTFMRSLEGRWEQVRDSRGADGDDARPSLAGEWS